jgi:nitric oxide reductase NorE protein
VFALFFFMYVYQRNGDLALYQQSQSILSIGLGAANTLLLLLSSWCVVGAVKAVRQQSVRLSFYMLSAATLLGIGFLGIKLLEYQHVLDAGVTWLSNDYYLFYFLLTGIHFGHVVTGVCVLAYFTYVIKRRGIDKSSENTLESAGIFWHMVDLLWILIFPLLYLLP